MGLCHGIGEAILRAWLLGDPGNCRYPFGSSALEMGLDCLRPIIGSHAPEFISIFPTNFGGVACEIPWDAKSSKVFTDGMFPTLLPIDQ